MRAVIAHRLQNLDEIVSPCSITQRTRLRSFVLIIGKIEAHCYAKGSKLARRNALDRRSPHAVPRALLFWLAVIRHPADRIARNPVDALATRADGDHWHRC